VKTHSLLIFLIFILIVCFLTNVNFIFLWARAPGDDDLKRGRLPLAIAFVILYGVFCCLLGWVFAKIV